MDDLTDDLRHRFAMAATTIQPDATMLVTVRERYGWHRKKRLVLLPVAVVGVAATATTMALTVLPRSGPTPLRTYVAASTPVRPSEPSRSRSITVVAHGDLVFTLPNSFEITDGPVRMRLSPTASDPDQENGHSVVTLLGNGTDEVVIATYEGAVGTAANLRARDPDQYGKTPVRTLSMAGHEAFVSVVDSKTASPCRHRPGHTPSVRSRTCGTPLPHIDIEVEVSPRLHLSMSSSGLSRSEALAIARSGL